MTRVVVVALALAVLATAAWSQELRDDGLPAFGEYVYVEELPGAVWKTTPEYPAAARQAGVEGTVMVQALVDGDGRVADTRVVKSIPLLDPAAVECVLRWRFKPASANGRPVAVWIAIPVKFSLRDAQGPGPAGGRELEHPVWPPDWSAGDRRIVLAEPSNRVDVMPEVVRRVEPELPGGRRDLAGALVVVRVQVRRNGSVGGAWIAQSEPALDAAALRAVRRWRFRPARRGGRPVPAAVYVPVRFASPQPE
jgi:TonB family protein